MTKKYLTEIINFLTKNLNAFYTRDKLNIQNFGRFFFLCNL